MNCLVCGKNYEAAECPRCGFPYIQLAGDQREVPAALAPTVQKYRENLLRSVGLELVVYRWKDRSGTVTFDREERISLGTADGLLERELWLPQQFARIANQKDITVTVSINTDRMQRDISVTVPNLLKPGLQQLGARVDSSCNLRLLLRGETEAPSHSLPVPLFPG